MSGLVFFFMAGLLVTVQSDISSNEETFSLQREKASLDNWKRLDSNIKNLLNSAIKVALPRLLEATAKMNLSDHCLQQGFQLMSGIKKMKPWAFSFIDASGKMVDGFLSGTFSSLGNFDQCMNTVVTHLNKEKGNEILFRGKYCLLEIKPPPVPEEQLLMDNDRTEKYTNFSNTLSSITQMMMQFGDVLSVEGARLGVCVPSGCTADDVKQVASFATDQLLLRVTLEDCQTQDTTKYDITAISIIVFFGLLGCLSIAGSGLELYSNKNKISFHSKVVRIILAFSIISNFKSLFNMKTAKNQISSLDGIRFLTITWIVLIHTHLITLWNIYIHGNSKSYVESNLHEFLHQVFFNGFLSVESFFLLGGFLHYRSTASQIKKNIKVSLLVRLRRRLFRILPAYASAILLEVLFLTIVSTPRPHNFAILNQNCRKYWWTNLLFINNFQRVQDQCFGHSWYLATDMQFFILGFFTIPVLVKRPKIGIALNASVVLLTMLYVGINTWANNLVGTFIIRDIRSLLEYSEEYSKPFSHAGSYFIGILLSHFLNEHGDFKMSQKTKILGWIASAILCTSSLFGIMKWNELYTELPTLTENVIYASFSKVAFSTGLAWVVLCCSTGNGGFVNSFLSWKVWIPLSRLTFAIYLVSPIIHLMTVAGLRTISFLSDLLVLRRFFADFTLSFFMAVGLFVLVENPFTLVENIIFSKEKIKEKKKPDIAQTVVENIHI